jgi:hypothetical protein
MGCVANRFQVGLVARYGEPNSTSRSGDDTLRTPLSCFASDDLEEIMAERGLSVDHVTAMPLIRKGQIRWLPTGDVIGQRTFIHTLFGIAA